MIDILQSLHHPKYNSIDVSVLNKLDIEDRDASTNLLKEIITMFKNNGPNHLIELNKYIQDQDLTSAQKTAHSLKNSAQFLGAQQLAQYCLQLEETDNIDQKDCLTSLSTKISNETHNVLIELDKVLKEKEISNWQSNSKYK